MIARSLKDEQEIDRIKIRLFNLINPENRYFILDSGNRICRMALDLKLIPPLEIAERAVMLVDMMPANFSSYDFQFYLLKTAEKSFLKAGDVNRAKAIKIRAADALIQKAALVEKAPGQKLLSAQCLAEGMGEIRAAGACLIYLPPLFT